MKDCGTAGNRVSSSMAIVPPSPPLSVLARGQRLGNLVEIEELRFVQGSSRFAPDALTRLQSPSSDLLSPYSLLSFLCLPPSPFSHPPSDVRRDDRRLRISLDQVLLSLLLTFTPANPFNLFDSASILLRCTSPGATHTFVARRGSTAPCSAPFLSPFQPVSSSQACLLTSKSHRRTC